MALPLLAAVPAVLGFIGRMGVSKAIKKFGRAAVKKAQAAEKKTSGAVGSKKALKELPSKMKPTDKRVKGVRAKTKGATTRRRNANVKANQAATDSAKAANLRSGRGRIGTGAATVATAVGVPKVGGALSDSIASDYKKPPAKKPTAKESTGNFKAQPKAVEGKGTNLGKMQRDNDKMDANQKVTTAANRQKTAAVKRATVDAPVSKAPPKAKSDQSTSAPSWEQYKTIAQAKKAGSKFYSQNGKKMAAVYKEDLKPGQSLSDYMNNKLPKLKSPKAKITKPKGYMSGKTVRGNGIAARSKSCKMR